MVIDQPADDGRDELAADLLDAISELAVIVRERDRDAIRRQLARIHRLGGDRAALVVAAAMIPINVPVDPWWLAEHDPAEEARRHRAVLADAIGAVDNYGVSA